MKIRLPQFLRLCLLSAIATASAATYTDLSQAELDTVNHLYYDGNGNFYLRTEADTLSLSVTLDLGRMSAYLGVHDYPGTSPFVSWTYENAAAYGLADKSDTNSGGTSSTITGYWDNKAWENKGSITLDTLSTHAQDNQVTLNITNNPNGGTNNVVVTVAGSGQTLYSADGLRSANYVGRAITQFSVNTNYVTSVVLNTASTLDTATFQPPADYTRPFVSTRTDAPDTSVGRIMFMGDSITHGVADQSWRWQLFKSFVDNGIENEIVGPREGYHSTPINMNDTGSSYRGEDFANVHYAQASGRTYNMVNGNTGTTALGATGKGVTYGGVSTTALGDRYDCDTYVILMGTNDMLSDTANNESAANYATTMQALLGGKVTATEEGGSRNYSWQAGDTWGNMGRIVSDMGMQEGDTFYVMSVPAWTSHSNHNGATDHSAVQAYNSLLETWCESYNASGNVAGAVKYVDVNKGLVDITHATPFYAPKDFFNNNDGLHPSQQGSLIIAGNLARGMGLAGRTAGLERSACNNDGWEAADSPAYALASGGRVTALSNVFSVAGGYSVNFYASYGDGATNGWLDGGKAIGTAAQNSLSITVGDGTNGGVLNLTEGYIMWGNSVLYCRDNSQGSDEAIRISFREGDSSNNIAGGYYVWLDDMLIGQGLSNASGVTINGVQLSATGGSGTVAALTYADKAYAPSTTLSTYYDNGGTAPAPPVILAPMPDHNNSPAASGINWDDAATASYAGSSTARYAVSTAGGGKAATVDMTITSSGQTSWVGAKGGDNTYSGDVNLRLTEGSQGACTVFGVVNGGLVDGNVTVELDASNATYTSFTDTNAASLVGGYSGRNSAHGSISGTFRAVVNAGTLQKDIIGGYHSAMAGDSIGAVELVINDGQVDGSVYGGSIAANGTVNGNISIDINGGIIKGNVVGSGKVGTVGGDIAITVTGGVIQGNIDARSADSRVTYAKEGGATASVTVEGNKAAICGNITADKVSLKNVADSGYADGFDSFAGSIKADNLTLDHYTAGELKASLTLGSLTAANGTDTLITSDFVDLDALTVSGSTLTLATSQNLAVGALTLSGGTLTMGDHTPTISVGSLTVEGDSTLNADLDLRQASITLNGKTLNLGCTLTLGGTTLDDSLPVASSQYVDLFTGVDSLALGEGEGTADAITVDAYGYIANVGQGEYSLVYDGAAAGGRVTIMKAGSVPEPATGTLSLLALAGLCARRRRK